MIIDMATIIWKETREMFHQGGRLKGGWLGMVVFIGVFGIFMPLQSGRAWVESPVGLVFWGWIPFLLVSSVIADSFAGERERHTLETLLASRLSDKAILFGKLAAAISYGWGFTMLSMLLSLVTINIVHGRGELLLYPLPIGVGIVLISFLIAWLASGVGTLISLRAATVRQAQQTFSFAFFALFIPMMLIPILPDELKLRLAEWLAAAPDINIILLLIGVILFFLNLALLGLALRRFQRAQLILD